MTTHLRIINTGEMPIDGIEPSRLGMLTKKIRLDAELVPRKPLVHWDVPLRILYSRRGINPYKTKRIISART